VDAAPPTADDLSLLFDVWLVMHLASGLLDDALAGTDLGADDFGLYTLLRGFGPATPSQIARWTGMRATTVSAGLKRMASRGHSVQHVNPDDGRSYLVALSAAGRKAHARAAGPFLEVMDHLHAVLGPDVPAERLALERLDAGLRETAGLPPRPYALGPAHEQAAASLTYEGPPLSLEQEAAVRAYVEFVRRSGAGSRRSGRASPSRA
jgi:DNA-binding MarR family transcriptional regulator